MPIVSDLPNYLNLPLEESQLLQAQRLFHGRGHAYKGLNHITIDWLPPVVLITLFTPEPAEKIEALADYLCKQIPSCQSVQLQHRHELLASTDIIKGESIQQLDIKQDDLQFTISLGRSRNTGLFLDMQTGRNWVQAHAHQQRVLNLFSYTCGFSVAAISGGARSVLNVDMSRAALNVGRDNHRLNKQALNTVNFEKLNIFKSFGRLKRRGPFDLLICDPPTFQKGSVDIIKDYPKILRRLDEFMAPKSTLMLCLNAPELDRNFLVNHMKVCAPRYTLTEEITPPKIYVEAEGKGLTILCFTDLTES